MRWFHYLLYVGGGGLMFGLGTRNELPLYAAIPMLMCGWRMMQIGTETFLEKLNA